MKTNKDFSVTLDSPGYYSLAAILERAFKQASEGKGKERHANSLPFDRQPMQTIAGQYGVGFLLGQAAKKSQESQGLPHDRAVAELLGAINYLAGAVVFMEANKPAASDLPVIFDRRTDDTRNVCAGCTTACHSYVFGACENQVRP